MRPRPLSQVEIAAALNGGDQQIPPILSAAQVAALLGVSIKTVYHWAAAGQLDGCYRKRGKHMLFWRDRVIDKIFNSPDWTYEGKKKKTSTAPACG